MEAQSSPAEAALTDAEGLCAQCADLDLENIFQPNGTHRIQLVARLDSLSSNRSCSLCRFLFETCGCESPNKPYDILLIQPGPHEWEYLDMIKIPALIVVPKDSLENKTVFENLKSSLIFDSTRMGRSTLQPIQPQVDLRLARRWLDFCVQEHWRRCQGSKKRVIDLMVIDCENRVIVPLPARGNYVTLSYVWGNHPEQERSSLQESSLPVPLPQTIEDAITVTKGLGYNYLWVDKYCIDQRKEDFHTKLRQMDVIYENSVLTIIAAAGSHSSYGLAGISKVRKSCSTQRLKSLPFLVADELRKSVWASRAWTFQEGLLSTRRLIFTEKQMYFECQGLYCFEGIPSSNDTLTRLHDHEQLFSTAARAMSGYGKVGIFPLNRCGHTDDVFVRIEEYSSRSLSHESDSLNAILGTLHHFESERSVRHIWGLPYFTKRFFTSDSIWPGAMDYLVHNLSWDTDNASNRRHGFPSWSWTGWRTSVVWDADYLLAAFGPWEGPPSTLVDICVETAAGDVLSWPTYQKQYAALTNNVNALSRFLHISAHCSRVRTRTPRDKSHHGELPGITLCVETTSGLLLDLSQLRWDTVLDAQTQLLLTLRPDNLLAIHMPWGVGKRRQFLLVECKGAFWERVGKASCYSVGDIEWKSEWRRVRLG